MNIRKRATTGFLTIGLLVTLAASLHADDMAYALGTQALGVQNPLGIVDLKTGVFTLIGNMGSGGYDGLAALNGVLYTEQNGLLYSVNTTNANLTLIGGINGKLLVTFGSTTTGLYGVGNTGSFTVATLFSINPETGAMTTIGPLGASAVPDGEDAYVSLSVGSPTLYLEFNSTLFTINTTTGAATQVGTTSSNEYLSTVPLFAKTARITPAMATELAPSTSPPARLRPAPRFPEDRGPWSASRPILCPRAHRRLC